MKLKSLALAVFGLAAGAVSAQTVLTVSTWLPPTHTASKAQQEWCDLLSQKYHGQNEMQYFAAWRVASARNLRCG